MMELSKRKKGFAPRSRSGCLECRHHHRKCDEKRPACALCQKYSRTCRYGLRIKWGGRPFGKSTFGKCMAETGSQHVQVVQLQPADRSSSPFVYGVTSTKTIFSLPPNQQDVPISSLESTSSESQVQQRQPIANLMTDELEIRAPFTTAAPSFLPDLPRPYRSLLDYFTRVANSFSCNEGVKRELCATFMPMATQQSHVMSSMLGLAAIHRANAGLVQSSKQLALLQTVAVQQLRAKVSESAGYPTEDIMATVLMLCYSDIVAGGDGRILGGSIYKAPHLYSAVMPPHGI
ncbi:hypothetical protein EDB81DRAFT_774186 [Dactylonectria macrodidyma]|uniref:Zn(2)-C6 fungal-type domain-containing protein n=1 Tax=Dactylonectria macrodidyma TaxID=307937 RepID=A0A9P9FP33_9HYPO|nr:hypothetical protein EDB81DRAFT_774186 [Dactylonectria macrodidyma]